jgi:glycosyltransferase involved in cell wall biosynthesis
MFDTADPASIADALERLLHDGPEVERLRAAGRERAGTFTWERAAERTLASYERALSAA